MKRNSAKTVSVLLGCLFFLAGCAPAFPPEEGIPSKQEEPEIVLTGVPDGKEVSVYAEEVSSFLDASADEQRDILLAWGEETEVTQIRQYITFSWDSTQDPPYVLTFSRDARFENAFQVQSETDSITLGLFIPGETYYWKVTSASGVQSDAGSFIVEDKTARFLYVPGLDNVRDLGGWGTESGKRVKYGMIYRGTQLNGYQNGTLLKEAGKEVFALLGIRSEIDFRTPGVDDGGQNESAIGDAVQYLKAPFYAYTCIFPEFEQRAPFDRDFDERTPQAIRSVFEFLAEESNYPVYIHCNAGADRTGTIAFLINGLLGVSYKDLTTDFELTSFSGIGRRWRGDLYDAENLGFGVMQDDPDNYVAWGKMYDYMMTYYGTEEHTLSSAVRNYLTAACAVPQKTLDRVCELLTVQEGA